MPAILPRLEDLVEMRGRDQKGLYRWYYEKDRPKIRAFRSYLGASVWTVFLSRLATSPLNHLANCYASRVMGYKAMIDILKSSTIAHLYPTILGRTVPSNVLTFTIAETMKFYVDGQSIVRRETGEKQTQRSLFMKNFYAGAFASMITSSLFYPVESCQRHRTIDMGYGKSRYIGVTHCMEQRYIQSGGAGLYKGMSVSLVGSMLYRGLFFGFFEVGRVNVVPEGQKPTFSLLFAIAFVTSAAAGLVTQPLDALRMTFFKEQYNNWPKAQHPWSFVKHVRIRTVVHLLPITLVKSVGPALALTMFTRFKKEF